LHFYLLEAYSSAIEDDDAFVSEDSEATFPALRSFLDFIKKAEISSLKRSRRGLSTVPRDSVTGKNHNVVWQKMFFAMKCDNTSFSSSCLLHLNHEQSMFEQRI